MLADPSPVGTKVREDNLIIIIHVIMVPYHYLNIAEKKGWNEDSTQSAHYQK